MISCCRLNAMNVDGWLVYGRNGHAAPPRTPRRIYIVGGPGSGKTTLAHQLSERLRLPVHELDEIAFIDFKATVGLARRRPLAERLAAVEAVARQPAWICEGLAAGWAEALLNASDLVIWLDVPWHCALRRILARYLHAVRFDPVPPTRRRWQPRAFVHGLLIALAPVGGSLVRQWPVARRALHLFGWWYLYTRNAGWAPLDALNDGRIWSRRAILAQLRPHAPKVLRLRRPAPAGRILAGW